MKQLLIIYSNSYKVDSLQFGGGGGSSHKNQYRFPEMFSYGFKVSLCLLF